MSGSLTNFLAGDHAAFRIILRAHNTLEEGPGGLYDTYEQLA